MLKGQLSQSLDSLVQSIVIGAQGLNYMSETDSEVFAVYRNAVIGELDGDVLKGVLRLPEDTLILGADWTGFFKQAASNDPSGDWSAMKTLLEGNLQQLSIFKIQRSAPYTAQNDVLAVGLFEGKVVGIQMFAVET